MMGRDPFEPLGPPKENAPAWQQRGIFQNDYGLRIAYLIATPAATLEVRHG